MILTQLKILLSVLSTSIAFLLSSVFHTEVENTSFQAWKKVIQSLNNTLNYTTDGKKSILHKLLLYYNFYMKSNFLL